MLLMTGIAVAAVSAGTPTLEWASTEPELGEIKSNEQKEVWFTFSNTGDEVIRILEAKESCGCTVVEVPKAEIMPGSAATIKAIFTSFKIYKFLFINFSII